MTNVSATETGGGMHKSYLHYEKDYKGKPISQKLEEGPRKNRKCRDVICLVIFIAFLVGWGYVCYFGMMNGKPKYLLAPFDTVTFSIPSFHGSILKSGQGENSFEVDRVSE